MFAWIINKFELIRQLFVQINKSVLRCLFERHDLEGLSRTCAGLKGKYELQNDSNYVTDSVTVVNQSLAGENSVQNMSTMSIVNICWNVS